MGAIVKLLVCFGLCSLVSLQDVPMTPFKKDREIIDYEIKNGCQCVDFTNCRVKGDDDKNPSKTGAGTIVPRLSFGERGIVGPRIDIDTQNNVIVDVTETKKNSPCKNPLVVCCPPSMNQEPSVRQPTPAPEKIRTYPEHCGQRNENGVSADGGVGIIHQGLAETETQFGEFPWMAMILQETPQGDSFVCGGSLISSKLIATAAHCMYNRKNIVGLKVRLGEWESQRAAEVLPHDDYYAIAYHVHPDYYPPALYNDVAVLVLDGDVEFRPHINTICLPKPGQSALAKVDCVATGWGKSNFASELFQNFMKKIFMPVVDNPTCQEQLRTSRLGPEFELHDSMMCAGGFEFDTCTGDGGGPLACRDQVSKDYYLAGIIAWGIDCHQPWPGVYADVSKAEPWLTSQVQLYDQI